MDAIQAVTKPGKRRSIIEYEYLLVLVLVFWRKQHTLSNTIFHFIRTIYIHILLLYSDTYSVFQYSLLIPVLNCTPEFFGVAGTALKNWCFPQPHWEKLVFVNICQKMSADSFFVSACQQICLFVSKCQQNEDDAAISSLAPARHGTEMIFASGQRVFYLDSRL